MKYLEKFELKEGINDIQYIVDKKLEVAVAAGASMAVLVIGVSLLTAFYAKTLMDINYIEESDVYDD